MGDGSGGAGWEVVENKREPETAGAAPTPISAEVRSYAEWFVWAKRAGGDLSGSHAAARAAVAAAASGGNPLQAAQGAVKAGTVTAVDQVHQEYCAWFAVANVDLGYDAPKSHVFAEAGLDALHKGMDVNAATAAAEAAAQAAPAVAPAAEAPAPAPAVEAPAVEAPAVEAPVAEKVIEPVADTVPPEPVAAVAPVDPPAAPVETVAETVPPPAAPPAEPVATVAETIPPPGATAELRAIPAAELAPAEAEAPVSTPEPVPAAAEAPVSTPEAPARTAADAVAAAAAFAGLGGVTRSQAKLALVSELVLASGIEAVPEGVTAERVWVSALLAATTAGGAALPATGCVVVMPVDLGQFWHLQAGARQEWPDWFDRLPDHSGE